MKKNWPISNRKHRFSYYLKYRLRPIKQAVKAFCIPLIRCWFSFMPNGMKCHSGHGYVLCLNRVRSRVFDRLAARTLRALDWTRFRRNPGKFFELSPRRELVAIGVNGIVRHMAA